MGMSRSFLQSDGSRHQQAVCVRVEGTLRAQVGGAHLGGQVAAHIVRRPHEDPPHATCALLLPGGGTSAMATARRRAGTRTGLVTARCTGGASSFSRSVVSCRTCCSSWPCTRPGRLQVGNRFRPGHALRRRACALLGKHHPSTSVRRRLPAVCGALVFCLPLSGQQNRSRGAAAQRRAMMRLRLATAFTAFSPAHAPSCVRVCACCEGERRPQHHHNQSSRQHNAQAAGQRGGSSSALVRASSWALAWCVAWRGAR